MSIRSDSCEDVPLFVASLRDAAKLGDVEMGDDTVGEEEEEEFVPPPEESAGEFFCDRASF